MFLAYPHLRARESAHDVIGLDFCLFPVPMRHHLKLVSTIPNLVCFASAVERLCIMTLESDETGQIECEINRHCTNFSNFGGFVGREKNPVGLRCLEAGNSEEDDMLQGFG